MSQSSYLEGETIQSACDGALAGLIATFPMTAVMKAIHLQLPRWLRGRLPPEQITVAMAEKVEVADELDRDEQKLLTLASHFGYGTMSGAAFGMLGERVREAPIISGAGFGLAVWAASYLGWLPAAGVRRSATEEPAGTNAMMIASHLVWGVSMSLTYNYMRGKE